MPNYVEESAGPEQVEQLVLVGVVFGYMGFVFVGLFSELLNEWDFVYRLLLRRSGFQPQLQVLYEWDFVHRVHLMNYYN